MFFADFCCSFTENDWENHGNFIQGNFCRTSASFAPVCISRARTRRVQSAITLPPITRAKHRFKCKKSSDACSCLLLAYARYTLQLSDCRARVWRADGWGCKEQVRSQKT